MLPREVRILMSGLAACFVLCSLAATQGAENASLQVTVSAGKHDRANEPVRLLVDVPTAQAEATVATLSGPGGVKLIGQLTAPSLLSRVPVRTNNAVERELNFILPELKAGETATYDVTLGGESSASAFAWKDEAGKHADLSFGSKPVLRYMYEAPDRSSPERLAETFKVYHHVYDPTGTKLLTKGPGGLFPHHRGIFYGFNKISYDGKSADTWHCRGGESQTHVAFESQEAGPVLGRHVVSIDWNGKDGKPFARELRELTAYHTPDGLLIEFASRLTSAGSNVKLDGDPQHAGFQWRTTQEVPDKTAKQTYYVRPDGKGEPGKFRNWPADQNHADLPWNALSFVLDDQRYTIGYLDRPQNPKPARFSERDYGRFGSYFVYELTPEKPLELNYQIWVQAGEMEVDGVAAKSAQFVEPATVKVTGG